VVYIADRSVSGTAAWCGSELFVIRPPPAGARVLHAPGVPLADIKARAAAFDLTAAAAAD